MLTTFDLFEFDIDFNKYLEERNWLIRKKLKLTSFRENVETAWNKLNSNQLHAVQSILNVVRVNEFNTNQFFFLDDLEGTNKIFVQNIVMNILRFEITIVLIVAFFDIVATLLEKDQIAHVRFKIFLNFNRDSVCKIEKNTFLIDLIKRTKLIFWNEFLMQRKYDIITVNRTISDLCDVNEFISFDNKISCFCEDFKQCTLVCSNINKKIIVNMNLKTTLFWIEIEILRLIINMRLQNLFLNIENKIVAVEFANEILIIDNNVTIENPTADEKRNKMLWRHKFIENNEQLNFIKTIYFNLIITLSTIQYLKNKIIFAIVNVNVEIINQICTNKLLNYVHFKYNYDRTKKNKNVELYFSKCFHHYDEISLSFHVL